MSKDNSGKDLSRRELLQRLTASVLVTAIATPIGKTLALTSHAEPVNAEPVNAVAGVDRVVMKHGKTYLNGWAGYGTPPRPGRGGRGGAPTQTPTGPAPKITWSKVS